MSAIHHLKLEELKRLLESVDDVKDLAGCTEDWRGPALLDSKLSLENDEAVLELYDQLGQTDDVAAAFTTAELLEAEVTMYGIPVLMVRQSGIEYPLAFYRKCPVDISTLKTLDNGKYR